MPVCVWVYTYECRFPQRLEELVSSGAGIPGGRGWWDSNSGALEKQYVLLTSESSLQLPKYFIRVNLHVQIFMCSFC